MNRILQTGNMKIPRTAVVVAQPTGGMSRSENTEQLCHLPMRLWINNVGRRNIHFSILQIESNTFSTFFVMPLDC